MDRLPDGVVDVSMSDKIKPLTISVIVINLYL